MFLHKLRDGIDLLLLLMAANLRSVVCACAYRPGQAVVRLRQSVRLSWLGFVSLLLWRGRFRVARLVRVCEIAGVPRNRLARNLEASIALAERDIARQKFERAVELLTPHIEAAPEHPSVAKCHAIRSQAHIWHGRYRETLDDLARCVELRPRYARGLNYMANLAQLQGMRGDVEDARRAMALHCGARKSDAPTAFLANHLTRWVHKYIGGLPLGGSVGVMFGAYNNALGHAILDPFHFYNLFRHRFDHLVLVHPPLALYSRSSLHIVSILQQYIEQIEIDEAELAMFAWQNLGEIQGRENLTFLCHNYWALNRMAYHARRDPHHPMSFGRRYLQLPPKVAERAESLCRKLGLEIDRPLVVLHTREHGYHRLRGQSYRNTDIRHYIPALRHLIQRGYMVVRIGDRHMMPVGDAVPGVIELPTLRGYDNILDPYFLSKCRFMLSCQSGPCSLARAFGKPNLVLNGVYHYTMLPEQDELFAFKRYLAGSRELSLEEILAHGCHLFDRSSHFEGAGIHLEDNTPEEIHAATEEMLERLDSPVDGDTSAQGAFRTLMREFPRRKSSHPLAHRLTDYIGYGLPEGRVSDAMCELRKGYIRQPRKSHTSAA
jgi:putative glycosyltransferase (TIGR04372 family)